MKVVLTIAGSDSMGGAGIQADIKTITALGAHATSVITAVTAQNSTEVEAIYTLSPKIVEDQMEAVLHDIRPDSVKIGMLGGAEIVRLVSSLIKKYDLKRVVVDPVLRASTGATLLEEEAIEVLKGELFPLAYIITPNIPEAEALCAQEIRDTKAMAKAAKKLHQMGPRAVVITGGHLEGAPADFFWDGETEAIISGKRSQNPHDHGSGCVFSSALAAYLAEGKRPPPLEATKLAQQFTIRAIMHGYRCGKGRGPVNPFFRWIPGGS